MSLTHITFGPQYEQIPTDAHRVVVSGELPAASSATMQSLVVGSNLVSQPTTITVTGSVGLNPNPVLDSLTVSGTGLFYAPIHVGSTTGANRVMVSGELAASEGMTSLVAGSNIVLAPTTITTTGTVGLDPNLSVSTGTFSSDVLVSGNLLLFAPAYQGTTTNRYVTSGEVNPGTITSLVAGSNIVIAPSPITGSGSVGLDPNPLVSSITVSGVGIFYGPTSIGTTAQTAQLTVVASGAEVVGQIVKAAANQTGDLLQVQDSSGSVLDNINSAGALMVSGTGTFYGSVTTSGIIGGNSSAGTLTLASTLNATKGKILFGTSAYDEANNRLGIGTATPPTALSVISPATSGSTLLTLESAIATQLFYNDIDFNVVNSDTYGKIRNILSSAGEGSMAFFGRTAGVITEVLRFQGNGNVEIGATIGTGKLTIARGGASGANAPTALTAANNYLSLGSAEYNNSSYRIIGFGYQPSTNTYMPAYIGYQEMPTVAGNTYGDLVFGTRSVTTDTQPSERMRITASGFVGIGTTTPGNTLDVAGSTTISGTAQFYDNVKTYGTVIMKSGMGDPIAPGAAMGMLRWEPGTNAGTLKLMAYAGTLASGVLIVDNVGSGS